jgi:hypothetical protein
MTTPRIRSLVSLVAVLSISITVGCASGASRFASDDPTSSEGLEHTVRFDNAARQSVHVYLVGWTRTRAHYGSRY